MAKYTIFVAYSLKEKGYTEKPNGLPSTHKLFDTPEEAINAIVTDIEKEYNNNNYRNFEIHPPEIKMFSDGLKYVTTGYFTCSYIFGPKVHYDIYITEID